MAHDDGWYNKVHYKDQNDYVDLLTNLIPNRLKPYKKKVPPLSLDVGQQLASLASDGLLIDLYRMIKSRNRVEIPFHVIGRIKDLDDMYNNMDRYKARARLKYWLVYKRNEWTIKNDQL